MGKRIFIAALAASCLFASAAGSSAQERVAADESRPAAPVRRAGVPDTADGARELANRVHRRGESLSRRVAFHLDEARRDGDARRAACLDGVLSQVNAALRMVGMRIERVEQAIRAGDAGRRRHEVSVLGVLDARFAELDAATRTCNGERPDAQQTGTRVIVTVDRDVPRGDPTRFRDGDQLWVPPIPPPASPSI